MTLVPHLLNLFTDHRGYQHRRNRGLIAQIPQLFAGDVECVTREDDRFAL